jgi:hypothetical protein
MRGQVVERIDADVRGFEVVPAGNKEGRGCANAADPGPLWLLGYCRLITDGIRRGPSDWEFRADR